MIYFKFALSQFRYMWCELRSIMMNISDRYEFLGLPLRRSDQSESVVDSRSNDISLMVSDKVGLVGFPEEFGALPR